MAGVKEEQQDRVSWFDRFRAAFDSPFPWHAAQWQTMVRSVESGRQPQAWLICGPQGTGKRLFVHWWLKWAYCSAVFDARHQMHCASTNSPSTSAPAKSASTINSATINSATINSATINSANMTHKACGRCSNCIQIEAGTHADVLWVSPESGSKSVKIDQVRQIIAFTQQTAKRSGLRTVVIEPAQAMPVAAQNALLKTLEEPGPQTQLLLVADQVQGLLPTIASRTQRLPFGLPLRAQVEQWLGTLPEDFLPSGLSQKEILAKLDGLQGSPLQWVKYLNAPWSEARPELIKALKALSRDPSTFMALCTQWSQWPLLERLAVIVSLMQAGLRHQVLAVCNNAARHAARHAQVDTAYEQYDSCLTLYRKAQIAVSLNEPLIWESALICWQKFLVLSVTGACELAE